MPGIDGLRAIAVLAVFFYHVGLDWMPGGWLGVDLFFVISGYLITSLLLQEYEKRNHIKVVEFWLRRARRLLPAVGVLIAVTMLLAAIFTPSDIDRLRSDALASLFYVQNWHLIFSHQSYFEAFGRPSLFRQLWSLSVEEQFYLIWPLVFAAGLTRLSKRHLLAIVLGGIALSTILMAIFYSPGGNVDHAFYGTDTRAAALLVGVAMALVWVPGQVDPDNRRLGLALDVAGAIALFMVIRDFATFNDFDSSSYEGGILGFSIWAAIVVGACAHPATHLNRVLGTAPMLWLGLRSYSFYLWHWPVVTLTRPELDVSIPRGILIPLQLAVTLLLAHLSYEYIEQPFRKKRDQPGAPSWLVAGRTALAAGVVFTVLLIGWAGFDKPGGDTDAAAAAAAVAAEQGQPPPETTTGKSGKKAKSGDVLAIGDSVMLAAEPALQKVLPKGSIIDAEESRQASAYPPLIDSYKASGQLPDTVLIQVGNNGPVYSQDFEAIKTALEGVPNVYFVNVEVPRSWESQVNDELAFQVDQWPGAHLIDWQNSIPDLGADTYDGIHPTPEGAQIYANLVKQALASAPTSSSSSSSTTTSTTSTSTTSTTTTSTTG